MQLIKFLVLALVIFGFPFVAEPRLVQGTDIEKENIQHRVQFPTTGFLTQYLRLLKTKLEPNKNTPEVASTTPTQEKIFDLEVVRLANKYEQDEMLARAIIKCESLQYGHEAKNENVDKNGNVWSSDWGWWQINDYYHEENALEAGYDVINNKWDNLEYGFILLSEQGRNPWKASRSCIDRELKRVRVASTTPQSP